MRTHAQGELGFASGVAAMARVLAVLGVVGVVLRILQDRCVDLDVFHGMALAREALARGAFPARDVFAFTPTLEPVVHHEWGTGAVLYAVHSGLGLGLRGFGLLRLLLVAAILVLAWAGARLRGAHGAAMLVTAPLALTLLNPGLSPVRAQLFSFALFSLLLLFLELDRRGRRWWMGPWLVCHVLWLNLHGGVVVGMAAVGIELLERAGTGLRQGDSPRVALGRVRHLAVVALATVALLPLNPYGWRYPVYLWRALTMPRPNILEWAPLWRSPNEPLVLASVAVSFALLAYVLARGASRSPGAWLTILLAAATLFARRNVPLYGIAWFAFVAPGLAAAPLGSLARRSWRQRPLVFGALGAYLLATGVHAFVRARAWDVHAPGDASGRMVFPVEAVEFLRDRSFEGNLVTTFGAGGYVSWALHPRVRVSLDSRYEAAYPPALLEEHLNFLAAGTGWESLLTRYSADAVLVPRSAPVDAQLARAGATLRGGPWLRVYADPAFAIYARPDVASRLASAAAARARETL